MAILNSGIDFIDRIVDNNLSWFTTAGTSLHIDYSVSLSTWQYESANNGGNITASNINLISSSLIEKGLQVWANIANVTYATSSTPKTVFRQADTLSYANGSISGIDTRWDSNGIFVAHDVIYDSNKISSTEGSSGFTIIVHEIGHVLGLDDVYFSGGYNQSHTIMTPDESYGIFPSTPMIYDIAAAQYLYGANTSTNSGNDTYDGGEFDGSKKMWTIWDADGEDEIDVSAIASANKGVTIDLRGGVDEEGDVRFSAINKERVAIALDPDEDWEIAIEIEHATGHDGDDVLIGNDAANLLHGGEGMDSLLGGFGDDELYGDDGHDLIADTWWTGFDAWEATDNSNDLLSGGDGNDELVSYDGSDNLFGGAGNDKNDKNATTVLFMPILPQGLQNLACFQE